MDTNPNIKPKSPVTTTVPIRISKSTAKNLRSIVTKCNRKPYGGKVKVDDVIAKSLNLLQEEHIEEIKSSTYSSQDQIEIEFKKYCQTHESISKDAFLKLLLAKAIPNLKKPETNSQESK